MPRDVTLHTTTDTYDVCVVGGGLAGTCAALAAARHGAKTALVTDRPVLGGNSSSELRIPPCGTGYYNPWGTETGIVHELILDDRAQNHDRVGYGHANGVWDYVLYSACRNEPNLTLHLNLNVSGVTMADDGTIAEVSGVQAGSATTLHVPARYFIDASGDGCVGVGAGVPFKIGAEPRSLYGESQAPEDPDDFVMGNTLTFRARDVGYETSYTPPAWAQIYDYPDGIPYRSTAFFAGGYWWIEVGWPFDTVHDQDQIRDELLRHVYGIWDHIKNRGQEVEQAKTWVLDWVGMLPAKRESRRFVGHYVLTQQDLQERRQFDDVVAYGGWSIDDHTRGGILAIEKKPSFDEVPEIFYFVRPYGVPLGSLCCDEVDNLLFAGRVMSASRVAFSSLRVQQTLATTGQAAGTAAAYCAKEKVAPTTVVAETERVRVVQSWLLRDDAWLPGVALPNLASGATATASSVGVVVTEAGEGAIPANAQPAALLPLESGRLEAAEFYLDNRGEQAEVTLSVLTADHLWDLEAMEAEPVVTTTFTVGPGEGWRTVELELELESRSYCWLRLEGPAEVVWRYAAEDPLGTVCAYRRGHGLVWFAPSTWNRWKSLAVNVQPLSRPYTPDQVLTSTNRPDDWVNCWISDPAQALPQSLELSFPEPRCFNVVQLVFDTQLNRINLVTPGFHRAPECVRDYLVEAKVDRDWQELVSITGNYQRRREHVVDEVTATALRVTVTATNGDASARIYGVRLDHDV